MNTTAAQTQTADAPQTATVLFVDDEENILSALKRLFRPMNYRLFAVTSGAAGLEVLGKESVDVVVSDMRMPQMDGAAFLEQVANRWPDTVRILLTGYADVGSTVAAINKGHIYKYVAKPWEDNDLRLTVEHAIRMQRLEQERARLEALTRKQNDELRELNAGLETRVAARTEDLRQAMGFLETAHEGLKKNYIATIRIFANLAEMREGAVGGHARRVTEAARRLAAAIGMDEATSQHVMFAALLHDIGKIGLPDGLIRKPFNALTAEERAAVVRHPVIGQALLMALEPLHEAAQLIRHHHERFDGAGFPDGVRGEAIPPGARLLAVVNDYDALVNGMLTLNRQTPEEARGFLIENKGKRYDPGMVDAFLRLLHEEARQTTDEKEQCLKSGGLQSGMVLARDLLTREGMQLLTKGYKLDERAIRKIQDIERALGWDFSLYVRG
ncbi:MAG: two-component system response regulator [Candidatus Muproteobacteria bacterium RBG_16_65_34]|uniref:Two-component system response regulator n=1 Tax=Candidatus Muproteobacteria bacterium RBG_16_65_34 TaxID=1817760 RepID=A0A1F6TKH2_9PROT|nr:MAG: two-component system response regulator [Candidatus Muproteobacteria bacterium RBG_16_65_34]